MFEPWKKLTPKEFHITEYYFWIVQFLDPSGFTLADRIKEDIKVYRDFGMTSMYAFVSPRSFFPNGFLYYIWARLMYNENFTTEELKKEYFSCAYGGCADEMITFFEEVSKAIDIKYTIGAKGNPAKPYYCLEEAEKLAKSAELTMKGRLLFKKMKPQNIQGDTE